MSDEGRARARRLAAGWERRFYSELWVDEIEAALTAARAEGEAAGNPLGVQRYDASGEGWGMEKCPEGPWVRWSDVWRYLAELAAIRARKEGTR